MAVFGKLHIRWWYPLAALIAAAALILAPTPALLGASAEAALPTLIIDAGHGGADGGAVAPDGVPESDINLDIALRLEALCAFWGVDTQMTRTGKSIDYPEDATTLSQMKKADQHKRLELINSRPDAVLLSIHQNNYPAASPRGIQVFYGPVRDSDALAVILQQNLTAQLYPENRRIAEPIDDGIYLMRRAECRAVLVECGFLSNPGDLERLESEAYRTKLAAVMLASYLQYTKGMST